MTKAKTKKPLVLVLNKKHKVAYPKTDDDFEALKALGTSVKFCDPNFVALLEDLAKPKGYEVTVVPFEDLESKALSNLESKWPGQMERTTKGPFSLSCPKDAEHLVLMKSVRHSLAEFYANHGMLLKYHIKRGSRNVKVTFTTELNSSVFVTQDER